MARPMSVQYFDSLDRRDFDNGAMLDAIRQSLVEREAMLLALRKIYNPIRYLQAKAREAGAQLDGRVALQLAADPHFLQGIAGVLLQALDLHEKPDQGRPS